MANEELEASDIPDDSGQANGPVTNETQEEYHPETSGWLMKRSKISHKWKKQWFILQNRELAYGNVEAVTPKRILLEGAEIAESNMDGKPHGFRIKPKGSKRVFYFHTDNEENQHNWMQAICFAKASGRTDKSEACAIQ